MTRALLSLVPIVLVTAAVGVVILLFEKKRAEQIEADRRRYRGRSEDPPTRP